MVVRHRRARSPHRRRRHRGRPRRDAADRRSDRHARPRCSRLALRGALPPRTATRSTSGARGTASTTPPCRSHARRPSPSRSARRWKRARHAPCGLSSVDTDINPMAPSIRTSSWTKSALATAHASTTQGRNPAYASGAWCRNLFAVAQKHARWAQDSAKPRLLLLRLRHAGPRCWCDYALSLVEPCRLGGAGMLPLPAI